MIDTTHKTAEEMREEAVRYLERTAETFNEYGEHPCGRAFLAAAGIVGTIPLRRET